MVPFMSAIWSGGNRTTGCCCFRGVSDSWPGPSRGIWIRMKSFKGGTLVLPLRDAIEVNRAEKKTEKPQEGKLVSWMSRVKLNTVSTKQPEHDSSASNLETLM